MKKNSRTMLKSYLYILWLIGILSIMSNLYASEKSTVTGDTVRLRKSPNGEIIARLNKGDIVEILGKSEAEDTVDGKTAFWYEIRTNDKKGWVFGGFLETEKSDKSGKIKQYKNKSLYPILGIINGINLEIYTYKDEHNSVPQDLYALDDAELVKAHFKEYKKVDAGKLSSLAFGAKGMLIYLIENRNVKEDYKHHVLVFDHRVAAIKVNDDLYKDSNSDTQWQIIELTSYEGGHTVVKTIKNGRCVQYIDYYQYADYETEADPEEKFNEAFCGEKIEPENANP